MPAAMMQERDHSVILDPGSPSLANSCTHYKTM